MEITSIVFYEQKRLFSVLVQLIVTENWFELCMTRKVVFFGLHYTARLYFVHSLVEFFKLYYVTFFSFMLSLEIK